MESTEVYWIAPHEGLEAAGLEVLLVDTRQLARVPGRDKKTDPTDCEEIQRLHSCGLFRSSFRPREEVCMLRTLMRDQANRLAECGGWLRRMQKAHWHRYSVIRTREEFHASGAGSASARVCSRSSR